MGIKAVFFDLFNTLAFYYPPREERHAEAIRKFGFEIGTEAVQRAYVEGEHFWTLENARHPISLRSQEQLTNFYAEYEAHLLAAAGINISPNKALEIYLTYRKQSGSLTLYEDVLPTLFSLKEKGLILGLISNIEEDVVPVCKNLGLETHLNVMVGSGAVGFEKPDTRVFVAALNQAGVKANQAIHVGDQYHSDIVGARLTGMVPILLDRQGFLTEFVDCVKIHTLDEIMSCI